MSYNMMIGYDIYDRFTMEHFLLCQSIILTTSFFFCSRQYIVCMAVRQIQKKTPGVNRFFKNKFKKILMDLFNFFGIF
jgi:hypothetical protein